MDSAQVILIIAIGFAVLALLITNLEPLDNTNFEYFYNTNLDYDEIISKVNEPKPYQDEVVFVDPNDPRFGFIGEADKTYLKYDEAYYPINNLILDECFSFNAFNSNGSGLVVIGTVGEYFDSQTICHIPLFDVDGNKITNDEIYNLIGSYIILIGIIIILCVYIVRYK